MKNYSQKGRMGVCIELKNDNYGSMLQSYATQYMLKDYGIDYDLLIYKKKYTPIFFLKSLPRGLNYVLLHEIRAMLAKKFFLQHHPELSNAVQKRKKAFAEFREKFFCAPKQVFVGYNALKEGALQYNSFLSGSDQMWSPVGLPSNFYNLMFSPNKETRISYASSFGVKQIPWFQITRTKKYLRRIEHISCRENSGRDIIKKLIQREVPVVVDPTLLFTGAQWLKMLPTEKKYGDKYIFSYLLGPDPSTRQEVEKLKNITGLPIISIHQYLEADLDFGDISIEDAGPAEFISLINNATYICTDSFHGSVFSILMHKQFVVFNRYKEKNKSSKNTRIESLCKNLGLEKRRFSGDIVKDAEAQIDYEKVDRKVAEWRQYSYKYLEDAFDSIDIV